MNREPSVYCYVLLSADHSATYCGVTNNTIRRLRQHNGELVGGARYTRKLRPWKYAFAVTGFTKRGEALSFERYLKLATRKSSGDCPLDRRINARDKLLSLPCWEHIRLIRYDYND